MTPKSDKNRRERTRRKGVMDRRKPTVGRENQQRGRTVHQQTLYHTSEIFHSQQDLTIAVFLTSQFTFIQVQIQRWIAPTLDLLNLLHLER